MELIKFGRNYGGCMETFVLNNIIFDKNGILIKRKKEDFKISIDNIKNMQYTRKRFLNYLFMG